MKLGMCTNFLASRPDATGLECLDSIVSAGFDFLEVPAGSLLALPADDRKRAEDAIRDSGLPCLSFNSLFQSGIRLSGPAVDDGLVDDYIERALAMGKRLGVETMVFGSGGARNVPFGFSPEKAWEQLVDMLRRFAPKAAANGVTVVVEHLNRLEGNIVDSFPEAARMVREVDHPNVRCLVDFFHLDLGRETVESILPHFDLLAHAHFANVLGRSVPASDRHEERLLDFLAFMKRHGFGHKISVEGYLLGRSPDVLMPDTAKFLREHIS